jgi:hypothetical protein
VKKIILILSAFLVCFAALAQDSTIKKSSRNTKKDEKRQRISAMIKQEEEGVLSYTKQTVIGLQLRTNGFGAWFELGRRKSPRWTNLYTAEITEIKNRKEVRLGSTESFFGNTYIYGKVNNFYQFRLGYGQQYIFGQKGNKNGVAVTGSFNTGLSLGLLKPYYLQVDSAGGVYVKYDDNPAIFLDRNKILGGGGLSKGWSEVKMKPGLFAKAALRFDFGRYNESIQALEIGISADYFSQKIQVMAPFNDSKATAPKQLFYQGHIAFIFGSRK